ncbi:MAG: hypothetical protein AAFY82_08715 [Pseudomonadota bacterium]
MLPFPRAHWYVAAFMALTFAAFLPTYYAILPKAPWVHHLHGITATLWIVLVMTQNWTAHHRKWKLHVWSGMASLPLVPVFTIGGLLVTQHTLIGDSPFKDMFGTALSVADLVVSAAFVALYALALRYRRTPDLHARYMLGTVILLAGPSISRLFSNYVPGFLIRGLEDLPKFGAALDASFILAAAFCLVLILRDYLNGKSIVPFSAALAGTVVMVLGYYTVGYSDAYQPVADWIAACPAWLITLFAIVTSSAAVWWGWSYPAPRQTGRPPAIAASPAE